jgi:hypothetical protein
MKYSFVDKKTPIEEIDKTIPMATEKTWRIQIYNVEIKYGINSVIPLILIFWKKSRRGIAILTSANIFKLFSVSYVICFSLPCFLNNNLYFLLLVLIVLCSVSNRIKFSICYFSKKSRRAVLNFKY